MVFILHEDVIRSWSLKANTKQKQSLEVICEKDGAYFSYLLRVVSARSALFEK